MAWLPLRQPAGPGQPWQSCFYVWGILATTIHDDGFRMILTMQNFVNESSFLIPLLPFLVTPSSTAPSPGTGCDNFVVLLRRHLPQQAVTTSSSCPGVTFRVRS